MSQDESHTIVASDGDMSHATMLKETLLYIYQVNSFVIIIVDYE